VTEVVHACPLCGMDRNTLFDQCEFRGQMVINRMCLNCGLVFQSPRMTEDESAAFYAQEYRLLNEGSAEPTSRNLAIQRRRAESLYEFTKSSNLLIRRHLDIGCSIGVLLQRFQQAYHCQSAGIEPGELHRNAARKAGLSVYASLDELEQGETGRFELISMAHVLEHMPDPVKYLVHLRDTLLDPAGSLLLEVPNLYAHDSFEPAHLVSYSTHTVQQVLEKAGFEIVRLEKHGRPHSAWLPLYITLLAVPKSSLHGTFHLRPERWVKRKRQAGFFRRHLLERLFSGWVWDTDGK
jgi:2-polyprenyl-3-methyl-5-hydroxy-6-metoxy-1,4-benzoquinol methylase